MRGALAASVGVLVVLASGCGGGGGDRLSKEDFQTQANAICAKYQKQLNALGSPTTLDEIPGLVDQALAILNKEIDEISALKPPEELQSQFDQVLQASNDTKKAAADLSTAAKAGDQAAVQKALQEGNAASAQADKFAGQLGLDSCTGSS
jgi:hypothetical protein